MTQTILTHLTGRERIQRMIAGQPVDHLPFMPITMMFASDAMGVPYHDYASDYRVLAEGQCRTAALYGADHVSCISDPAREAADCGARVVFFPDQPPAIREDAALLADKNVLAHLRMPDPLGGGRMHDRVKAAALLREKAGKDLLVEGWVEGPCAEGADLRGINHLMMDFIEDPGFVTDLFAFVLAMELAFAREQIKAGADIIGLGDAAASLIGPALYEEYVWPIEKQMVDEIHKMGAAVRLHICGNTTPLLSLMGGLECEIVDLDHMVSLAEARAAMGPDQVLLGNLDPVSILRNGTPEMVHDAAARCHQEAGSRFIVGAGCEIPRGTPAANLRAMGDYARNTRP